MSHAAVAAEAVNGIPQFRKVEVPAAAANVPANKLRLLTDADFPPFSFLGADGHAMGLSVDIALAACLELKISCKVEARSFGELVPALERDEGDVIISGIRLDEKLLSNFSMTRPYFWSFGRFGSKLSFTGQTADMQTIGGSSIGVIAGSSHEAWIVKYFPDASIKPFKTEAELHAALKAGDVDVVFEDGLRLAFWVSGSSSGSCCRLLDGPFVDRKYFSHNLVFLTKRSTAQITKALDAALDQLQQQGVTAKLMQRYLPQALW